MVVKDLKCKLNKTVSLHLFSCGPEIARTYYSEEAFTSTVILDTNAMFDQSTPCVNL